MGNYVLEPPLPFQFSKSNFVVLGQIRTVSSVISFLPLPPAAQALKWLLENITARWSHEMLRPIKLPRATGISCPVGQDAHPCTGISPFCRPVSPFSPCVLPRYEPPKLISASSLPFPAALTPTAGLGLHLTSKSWAPCGGAGPEDGQWGWGFCHWPCEEPLATKGHRPQGDWWREEGPSPEPPLLGRVQVAELCRPHVCHWPHLHLRGQGNQPRQRVVSSSGLEPTLGFNEQLATPN